MRSNHISFDLDRDTHQERRMTMKKYLPLPILLLAAGILLTQSVFLPHPVAVAAEMTIAVTTSNDSGPGSFREAIERANSNPGRDRIVFDTGSNDVFFLDQPLPAITDPVIIDGLNSKGFGTRLLSPLLGGDGLTILAGDCIVSGLAFNSFGGSGISVRDKGGNRIEGNEFFNNRRHGVELINSSDNTIAENRMSGN